MKNILLTLMLAVTSYTLGHAQLQKIGKIKDPQNYGVRVHYSNGDQDFKQNGQEVNLASTTFVEIMGPFRFERNGSPIVLTESGNAGSGTYTVRKTDDRHYAIAYSGPSYTGRVTYLKLNQDYNNLYGTSGIRSMKTTAKVSYRNVQDGATSGSWPYVICRQDRSNISPAAKDVRVEQKKCLGGPLTIN